MKGDLLFEQVDVKRVRIPEPHPSPFPKNHLQPSAKLAKIFRQSDKDFNLYIQWNHDLLSSS